MRERCSWLCSVHCAKAFCRHFFLFLLDSFSLFEVISIFVWRMIYFTYNSAFVFFSQYTGEKFSVTDEQSLCPCRQSGQWCFIVYFHSPDGAASVVKLLEPTSLRTYDVAYVCTVKIWSISQLDGVFTAPCCVSAVYVVVVCPSVCYTFVFYWNV